MERGLDVIVNEGAYDHLPCAALCRNDSVPGTPSH